MLRQLRRMKGARSSGSDGSNDSDEGVTKSGSKLRGIQRLRKHVRKKPRSVTKQYTDHVKVRLGVRNTSKPWTFMDYSTKLLPRFGKMKGLWRAHWLMSNVLQSMSEGETDYAMAFWVQSLKCLHQVALDGGGWHNGQLLIPEEDPLAPEEYGGSPKELMAAQSYRGALAELKRTAGKGLGKGEKGEEDA